MKIIFNKSNIIDALSFSVLLNVFSKIFSFLRVIIIAIFLGYSSQTDLFYLAIAILGIFLLFGNVFDTLGIPLLTKHIGSLEKYYHFLFFVSFCLAVILSVGNYILAPFLVEIVWGIDDENKYILMNILKLLSPYIFFSFMFHHFGTLFRFNSQYQFFYFGLLISSMLYTIMVFIFYYLIGSTNIYWLPISMSIGMSIAALAGVYYGKKYFGLKFIFSIGKEFKPLLKEFITLTFAYAFLSMFLVIDKLFASSLEKTSITALSLALFIVFSFRGLMNFEHILMTPIAKNYGNSTMTTTFLYLILYLSLFVSLYLNFNAHILINTLLNYGLVKESDIFSTIHVFEIAVFLLPLLVVWSVVFRIFQVYDHLYVNIGFIVASLVISVLCDYIFINIFNLNLEAVIYGLLIGYLFLNFTAMFFLASKRIVVLNKGFKKYISLLPYLLIFIIISILMKYLIENIYIYFVINTILFVLFFKSSIKYIKNISIMEATC